MTNKISAIYIITNIKNEKIYVGQTHDLRKRWNEHKRKLNNNVHVNIHLQRAWNKYGAKNFKFLILEYCDIEQLNEREQHYINIYMSKNICYNIASSVLKTTLGLKMSEEARQKISDASKKRPRKPHSAETKRKISEAHKGMKASEGMRQKISAINKGKVFSEDHKRKISEALKGKTVSQETCHKISELAKARPRKPHSEGTRQKMSEARKLYHARKRAEREASLTNESSSI